LRDYFITCNKALRKTQVLAFTRITYLIGIVHSVFLSARSPFF